MISYRHVVLLMAILLLLTGCSSGGDDDNPAGNGGPSDSQIDDAMAVTDKQLDYYEQVMAVAAGADTAAAFDSLLAILQADPEVDWATKTGTGVNIHWKNGLNGIITLRLLNGPVSAGKGNGWGAPAGPVRTRGGSPLPKATAGGYRTPKYKKTLLYAPCYSEFRMWDETVIDSGGVFLPQAGYETFRVLKDEKATLAELKSMGAGEYGLIRFSSHGAPWPSKENIQEVYLITGEEPTKESFVANWEMIEAGHLLSGAYAGGKRFYLDSYYFAAHNDFGDGAPLVSLGFCFGYLGYWPGDMMTNAHAGGVIGWDWEVLCGADVSYFSHLLHNMCDTSRVVPLTLKRWHAIGDSSYTETDGRVISIHCMAMPDSFGLWTPLRIDSLSPDHGNEGDTIAVHGVGFGAERGSAAVRFDDSEAGVLDWTDTRIRAIVPDGADGYVDVFVVKDGRESNKVPFVAGADTLLALLHTRNRIEVVLNGDFRAGEEEFQRWDYLQPKIEVVPNNRTAC